MKWTPRIGQPILGVFIYRKNFRNPQNLSDLKSPKWYFDIKIPYERYEQEGFADLDSVYLSDLNERFGYCVIDENNE